MHLHAGHEVFGYRDWLVYYGHNLKPEYPHWIRSDDRYTFVVCEQLRGWFDAMQIPYRPDEWKDYYRAGQHTSAIWLEPHHAVLTKLAWFGQLGRRSLY